LKKEFSETLKELRINAGFSQKQIYDILGVRQSTFSAWETGRAEPSADMLLKLCKLYKVSDIFSAFGYDGYKEDGSLLLNLKEIEHIEKYRALDNPGRSHVDMVLQWETERLEKYQEQTDDKFITLIEVESHRDPSLQLPYWECGVSSGNGIYQLDDTSRIMLTLWATELTRQADFIIKISGASMEPDYHDGDKVLVNRKDCVEIGEVGIFVKNGDTFIKELGDMELISRNPDYPNIPVQDFDNVVCLGKVIGILKDSMVVKE